MAFNKESNGYIIGFSVVLVIVVGTLLAVVSMGLKPIQQENLLNEKKQYILNSALLEVDREGAGKMFDQYITKRLVLDYKGNIKGEFTGEIGGADDAFNIDIVKEYRSKSIKAEDKNYPLFVCDKDGERFYIIPVVGKGLWDLIWGYICLKDDGETVYGAVFDHKAETPGLGSEIAEEPFQNQFQGKRIANANSFTSIDVVKPGSADLNEYMVDGISGGTFTSVGVKEMMQRTLEVYYNFLKNSDEY